MKNDRMLLVVVFVLVMISTNPLPSAQQPAAAEANVALVLSWPGGFCKASPCRAPANPFNDRFYIHGAWPQAANGSSIQNCISPYTFSNSQLKDLLNEMNRYWEPLQNPNNINFWQHEWEAHGTCSGKTVKEYFTDTLAAYKLLRGATTLESKLAKGNIKPGSSYPAAQYQQVIQKITNFAPIITCKTVKIAGVDTQVLYEISICFDTNLQTFASCTGNLMRCDSKEPVKLPLYSSRLLVSSDP